MKRRIIALLISLLIVAIGWYFLPHLLKGNGQFLLFVPFWYYAIDQYVNTYQERSYLGGTLLFGVLWGMIVLCSMRYGKDVHDEGELLGYMFVNYILWFATGYMMDRIVRMMEDMSRTMNEMLRAVHGEE